MPGNGRAYLEVIDVAQDLIFRQVAYDPDRQPVRVSTQADVPDLAAGAPLSPDGFPVVAGDRVLVRVQAAPIENGIYTVVTPGAGADGAWIRSTDFDTGSTPVSKCLVAVQEGTDDGNFYFLDTTGTPVVGTDPLPWSQLSGGGGGGGDWAATLLLGNISDGSDAVMSAGDALRGVDEVVAGTLLPGGDLVVRPGGGSPHVQASAVFTVVAATPGMTATIILGFAVGLTGANAVRTPGANDFDTTGPPAAVAADMIAAINDPANSYDLLMVATAGPGPTDVTVTRISPIGGAGNLRPVGTVTVPVAEITVPGASYTGGTNRGLDGAVTTGDAATSPAGNPRGENTWDLQRQRTLATQVASGANSLMLGMANTLATDNSFCQGYDNLVTVTDHYGQTANTVVGGGHRIVPNSGGGGLYHTLVAGSYCFTDAPGGTTYGCYGGYNAMIGGNHFFFDNYTYLYGSSFFGSQTRNRGYGVLSAFLGGFATTHYGPIGYCMSWNVNSYLGSPYYQTGNVLMCARGTYVGTVGSVNHALVVGNQHDIVGGYSHGMTGALRNFTALGASAELTVTGEVAFGNRPNNPNSNFCRIVQVGGETTGAGTTSLNAWNDVPASGSSQNFFILPFDMSGAITITVVGRVEATGGAPVVGDSAVWEFVVLATDIGGSTGLAAAVLHATAAGPRASAALGAAVAPCLSTGSMAAATVAISLGATSAAGEVSIDCTGVATAGIRWHAWASGPVVGA